MGSHRVGHDWSDLAAAVEKRGARRSLGWCYFQFPQVWTLKPRLCCLALVLEGQNLENQAVKKQCLLGHSKGTLRIGQLASASVRQLGKCINLLHVVAELLQGIGQGLFLFLLERMEKCELKRIIRWIKSRFLSVFFLLSVITPELSSSVGWILESSPKHFPLLYSFPSH